MARGGYIDLVLADDGDMFVFGVKRLFRDWYPVYSGKSATLSGQYVELDSFAAYIGSNVVCTFFSQYHARLDAVIALAVIAGCDYIEKKLYRVGITTAAKWLIKFLQEHDAGYPSLIAGLRKRFGKYVTEQYSLDLFCAMMTFKHQVVADYPRSRLCHLTPISDEERKQLSDLCPSLGSFDFVGVIPEQINTEKLYKFVCNGSNGTGCGNDLMFCT